jgi:dihydroxyacetone kinase
LTNSYGEAVQLMDVVRADTTSLVDGINTKLLDITPCSRPKLRKQQRNRLGSRRRGDGIGGAAGVCVEACRLGDPTSSAPLG